MSRFLIIAILIIFIGAILVNTVISYKEKAEIRAELDSLTSRINVLKEENKELEEKLEYFSKPENLEKELKSMFNYKKPDEQMMIVVP